MYLEKNHSSRTHMWQKDTLVTYLDFLGQELRMKRQKLGLKVRDGKALILCDAAAVHSVAAYKSIRTRFESEHHAILITGSAEDANHIGIPGGWGACGAPNDAWHQFFHALRRSYMRVCASQGSSAQLRKAMDEIDLSVDGAPKYSRPCAT